MFALNKICLLICNIIQSGLLNPDITMVFIAAYLFTAQHFPSSGMTLNERFTMYQRRAAEKEMMKPRKSPEIHR